MRAPRWRTIGTLFRLDPEVVAHDLHPGYLSTRWALETGLPAIGVQHHHAHIAAVLAEHGLAGPAVGLAFDGTGYGEDGHIWGAEVLVADLTEYRRVAHLRYVPLAGGDRADSLAVAQPRGIRLARPCACARRWKRCWRTSTRGNGAAVRCADREPPERADGLVDGPAVRRRGVPAGPAPRVAVRGSGGDGTGGVRRTTPG